MSFMNFQFVYVKDFQSLIQGAIYIYIYIYIVRKQEIVNDNAMGLCEYIYNYIFKIARNLRTSPTLNALSCLYLSSIFIIPDLINLIPIRPNNDCINDLPPS